MEDPVQWFVELNARFEGGFSEVSPDLLNQNRLSLPCDGDCYQHPDGMVLHCHTTLKEDA